jgi:hypothetical protein
MVLERRYLVILEDLGKQALMLVLDDHVQIDMGKDMTCDEFKQYELMLLLETFQGDSDVVLAAYGLTGLKYVVSRVGGNATVLASCNCKQKLELFGRRLVGCDVSEYIQTIGLDENDDDYRN